MKTIATCIEECRECARLFRLGRDVEAALSMVEVFEGAQQLLILAPADAQQQWAQILMQMLDFQERQDWLGVADYMEYELTELLQNVPAGR